MKKIHADNLCQIYHGDALEARKQFPEAVVITDPPYNVGYHYDGYSDCMDRPAYLAMLCAVLSGNSVVIHYMEDIVELAMRMNKPPEKVVAWVYPSNTQRQWRGVAWFNFKPDFSKAGQPYRNPKDKRVKKLIEAGRTAKLYDWWEINQVKNVSKEKTEHPCQIPFEVMDRIIKITSPKLVLDPFCGSGTTLLACKANGVPCIGVDATEKYAQLSAKRVSDWEMFV